MGSGTTAIVAKNLNREWMGFDIDDKYIDITEKRINQPIIELAQSPLISP